MCFDFVEAFSATYGRLAFLDSLNATASRERWAVLSFLFFFLAVPAKLFFCFPLAEGSLGFYSFGDL
jgi:hypothetical protein